MPAKVALRIAISSRVESFEGNLADYEEDKKRRLGIPCGRYSAL